MKKVSLLVASLFIGGVIMAQQGTPAAAPAPAPAKKEQNAEKKEAKKEEKKEAKEGTKGTGTHKGKARHHASKPPAEAAPPADKK